jgi:hypothetical protein
VADRKTQIEKLQANEEDDKKGTDYKSGSHVQNAASMVRFSLFLSLALCM